MQTQSNSALFIRAEALLWPKAERTFASLPTIANGAADILVGTLVLQLVRKLAMLATRASSKFSFFSLPTLEIHYG
jgi:hypothetical protein